MKIHIKYFASVREAHGQVGESWDTQVTNLAGLRDELAARGGAGAASLARGRSLRMALNQVMREEDAALEEGCEVAFFPPVTGG
jgi:molybdopterin synthase sulfur carrier subunit